ncbi:MAG: head decoration protein [Pseudomonadota bacterium]
MVTKTETAHRAEFIYWEEDNDYSRNTGLLKAGVGVIVPGTELARDATGDLIIPVPSASDGTEIPVGFSYDHADSTSADTKIVIIDKDAIVVDALLTRPTMTPAQKAAADAALDSIGIRVR